MLVFKDYELVMILADEIQTRFLFLVYFCMDCIFFVMSLNPSSVQAEP